MAVEREVYATIDSERREPVYFVPAAELSREGQVQFARRTNGSFQQDGYSGENIVFFAYSQIGFIFPDVGELRIIEKGKRKEVSFDQDRRENSDMETSHPDAIIVFEPNGVVHIVWPDQTEDIEYGFTGVTITPGINTKNVVIHKVQDMQNADDSILLDAANVAYERIIGIAA